MEYLSRAIDQQLDTLLPFASAVAIDGPKGVGKTETARRRAETEMRLDTTTGRERLRADPGFHSFDEGTILLDEWQKQPESWDYVRRAVDDGAGAGRFLLTGSATPQVGVDTHSGAGRILSVRMRPLALFEREGMNPSVKLPELFESRAQISGESTLSLSDYIEHIACSGFPGIYRAPEIVRNKYLDSYIERIVDRDLPDQGYTARNRDGLLRWMTAYAAASSTTTGYSEILDAATPGEGKKPAKSTTMTYREKLSEIWMLDPVKAWSPQRGAFAGLARAPKHQLADPALALRLLRIPQGKLNSSRFAHYLGPLFESLATLSVRVAAEAMFGSVAHCRTSKGDHEVDLIVQNQDGEVIAIEVKLAAHINDDDVVHLHWLKEKLGEDLVDMVVVNTGEHAYRRDDGVAVIPLELFGA